MGSYEANAMQRLSVTVDTVPELRGAGLAYVGNNMCMSTRDSRHSSGLKTFVVVKEDQINASEAQAAIAAPPSSVTLTKELIGLGLNCGGAVVGGFGFVGGVAAVPFTAGTSGLVSAAIWIGEAATIIQCINSIGRTVAVATNQGAWVSGLDSESWYSGTSTALDYASLVGVTGFAKKATVTYQVVRASTNRQWKNVLKNLSQKQRKRLTEEVVRYVFPHIQYGKEFQKAKAALKFPYILSQKEITKELNSQFRDAISAAFDLAGSNTVNEKAKKAKSFVVNFWQE